MKKIALGFASMIAFTALMSSCSTMNKSMREPNSRVDFTKNDFQLSEQVTGMAKSTKVLDIDWYRLFHKNDMAAVEGQGNNGELVNLSKIPVVGSFIADRTASYALYDMMNKNAGYDVIFYPQYEVKVHKPVLGIGLIYKKTTVKAMARLAKLK
jgi:hypothetical protein